MAHDTAVASHPGPFGGCVHLAAAFLALPLPLPPLSLHLAAALLALPMHTGKRIKQGILGLVLPHSFLSNCA